MLFFGEKVKATTDPDKKAMQVKTTASLFFTSRLHFHCKNLINLDLSKTQERQFATMKTCVGDLEAAVKEGNQEKVEVAKQRLLAEGKLTPEKSFAS